MAEPTTSILFSGSTPAAPTGDQVATPQTDSGSPFQNVDFIPKRATSSLYGTVLLPAGGMVSAAEIQEESFIYAEDTGSANAYAIALSPAPSIGEGSVAVVKIANANTGASTLAVNGGSATAIKKDGSAALASGDLSVGQIAVFVYDGADWQLVTGGGDSSPASSPITLQTNGTDNGSQSKLNLIAGSNVTLTDGGTGGVTIAASGGGGGGGGFSPYPASLTPPLSANFSWLNPNSYAVTNTDKSDRLLITIPPSMLGAAFMQTAALPAYPYTIDLGILAQTLEAVAVVNIALQNTGGAALRTFGARLTTSGQLWLMQDQSWTSVTAPGTQNTTLYTFFFPSPLFFVRITDNGTTRSIYYSQNGKDYVLFTSQASGTGLTPNAAGIVFYQSSASCGLTASIYHWLISTSILPQFAS